MLSSLNTGLVPQSSSILIIYRYITSLAIIHYLHKSYARQYKAGSGACISLSLSPLPPEIGESGPSYWERGDPPETSLHEPSVHLPCLACRLNPHFRPSTGVRGRQAGKARQGKGRQAVPQSVCQVKPVVHHPSALVRAACLLQSHYPTAYSSTYSETPSTTAFTIVHPCLCLPPPHAARRTPITLPPPLSLHITFQPPLRPPPPS